VIRFLSGGVLIALVVALGLAPIGVAYAAVAVVLVLAVGEYRALAGKIGLRVPFLSGALALGAAAAVATGGMKTDVVLISGFVALAGVALGQGVDRAMLAELGAAVVPALYIGIPLGALVAVRALEDGRQALFLLMLTVIISDTAQYYTGRLFGRRPLSPAISPKKTIEGAIGGFVLGALTFGVAGAWGLPRVDVWLRVLIGIAIVALGIVGDLFESSLKRAAGVKDSSTLIPGHGGILDRIDALLFAAPVYYVVLKYV
jgi:phosphatidate cytidylyltransferase